MLNAWLANKSPSSWAQRKISFCANQKYMMKLIKSPQ